MVPSTRRNPIATAMIATDSEASSSSTNDDMQLAADAFMHLLTHLDPSGH
jgi:hypothetical protein